MPSLLSWHCYSMLRIWSSGTSDRGVSHWGDSGTLVLPRHHSLRFSGLVMGGIRLMAEPGPLSSTLTPPHLGSLGSGPYTGIVTLL